MQVLVIDPAAPSLADGMADSLAESGWDVSTAPDFRSALRLAQAGNIDALVLRADTEGARHLHQADLRELVRTADASRVATVLLCDQGADELLGGSSLVDVVSPRATAEEVRARLSTLQRYQSLVRRVEEELSRAEQLGRRINDHFSQLEEEMRLAGRLQRDFLPQVTEPVGPLRFSTIFRPASWVSGDIYDIFRVDERHVAFYVADAVGHGMAASLLTMFIKKAIVAKRVFEDRYEILDPSETMQGLNDALASQTLPRCQFVTACYCLVNTDTLEMHYARGGHPYPLLVSTDGKVTELKTSGGLMGLFGGEQFDTGRVRLEPGQKLILYSDGLEVAYRDQGDQGGQKQALSRHRRVFEELASCSVTELTSRIDALLDTQAGSLNPMDDVTVVAVEVEGRAQTEPA